MSIIQEFESKLKIIGGEKVYSGREIMKTFGYDKWERFIGAINRAKKEIKDIKKQDENFIFVIDKTTGGRPKENVLLTLGACYLVLKKCDKRKENVQILLEYMSEILEEKKQNHSYFDFKSSMGLEKFFSILIIIFLCISGLYYITTYINYLNNTQIQHDFSAFYKKDVGNELKKQDEVFEQYDKKIANLTHVYSSGSALTSSGKIEAKPSSSNLDFETSLHNYVLSGKYQLNFFQTGWNQRSSFLQKVVNENIIKAYFLLGNLERFRDSCSLLNTKSCISTTKGDLKIFSNFWERTKNGYTLLNVKKVKSFPGKNIYCVEYKYQLKDDLSAHFITETFNYTTQTQNGFEQITGRYCEKITKGGKTRECPFRLHTYYCK